MNPYEGVDFSELMSEAPGGENHGREATGSGWRDLQTGETHSRSPVMKDDIASAKLHGTITKYFARGCRCDLCRQAAREYHRARRMRGQEV